MKPKSRQEEKEGVGGSQAEEVGVPGTRGEIMAQTGGVWGTDCDKQCSVKNRNV